MSNGARLVTYLAAFVIFCVAFVVEVAETKRLTWQALTSAGLALVTLVPLWDALKAN